MHDHELKNDDKIFIKTGEQNKNKFCHYKLKQFYGLYYLNKQEKRNKSFQI